MTSSQQTDAQIQHPVLDILQGYKSGHLWCMKIMESTKMFLASAQCTMRATLTEHDRLHQLYNDRPFKQSSDY
jgi:hypothetical protein